MKKYDHEITFKMDRKPFSAKEMEDVQYYVDKAIDLRIKLMKDND